MFAYIMVIVLTWLSIATQIYNAEIAPSVASKTTLNANEDTARSEVYEKAAIATDHETCSVVGKKILQDKGGSAVDATIAVLFCLGTVQFQSTGIGGGGFMQIYERKTKQMHAFDFRETLAAANNEQQYDDQKEKTRSGGMSVGVPSEVKGLRAAWKMFGKLDWGELVQPSVDIAKEGFKASKHLADHAKKRLSEITDPTLRALIVQKDGSTITTDTTIRRPKYARTLEIIRDNPDDFYTGGLSEIIVNDIRHNGGDITLDDLRNYNVKKPETINMKLGDLTLHTVPLPSGGPVLMHILAICQEYNFTMADIETPEKAILTYHRIVEAFKFSHSYRPHLGDPDHPHNEVEFKKMYKDILDPKVAKVQYSKISDERTQDRTFYSNLLNTREEDGTTHVSLLAENGDAVAATSSINYKFGALFSSETLGIIYNNQVADTFPVFSPWRKYTWAEENEPRSGVRPLSSMTPNIILDENGDVVMISGGSGGTRITLSVAWVIMMKLWFGLDLGSAVIMSRPYHCLFPEYIRNESVFPMKQDLVEGLKKKQHVVKSSKLLAVVQAIYKDRSNGKIYAKSDPRKQGKPDGY